MAEYHRPKQLNLAGSAIEDIEAAGGDSVRITLKDGTFILISPRLRDVHQPDEDLIIEVFPEGVKSLVNEDSDSETGTIDPTKVSFYEEWQGER